MAHSFKLFYKLSTITMFPSNFTSDWSSQNVRSVHCFRITMDGIDQRQEGRTMASQWFVNET